MHELSISHSLVKLVLEIVDQHDLSAEIRVVHLRLGKLSGVVPTALVSAFEMAAQGTRLRHSTLMIERLPIKISCPVCGPVQLADEAGFICTSCGSVASELLQGRELELSALELTAGETIALISKA